MPKSKTKRATEDLKGNAGPSKRPRPNSGSQKDKEISSGEVINKLKNAVKDDRILAIEEWIKAHPVTVEGLTVGQSERLCDVFCNESCWSDMELNPARLVKELANLDILDPFAMYEIACIECVESEIGQLFNKMLESFKLDLCHKGASKANQELAANDELARVELLRFVEKDNRVFSFWIDEKSGNLKENIDAEDGFNKAVDFQWSKGVEHFYNRLCSEEKLGKEGRGKLLTSAFAKLFRLQSSYKLASTLNFLFDKVTSETVGHKSLLVLRDDKSRDVIYLSLSVLIEHGLLCTVKRFVEYLTKKCAGFQAGEILPCSGYAELFSSLSFVVVSKDYDLDSKNEARSAISSLWKCSWFEGHKVNVLDYSKDLLAFIAMKNAIVNLIVDWECCKDTRSAGSGDGEKKDLVSDILKFAKDCCSDKSFKSLKDRIANSLDKTRDSKMIVAASSSNLIEELCKSAKSLSLSSASAEGPQSTLVGTSISSSPATFMHGNGEDRELVRGLLNGGCTEFSRQFVVFLNNCPSFLHSANKPGFFPAFFFGMFFTAHDAGILGEDERVYFRFDNCGNLKVAILTNDIDEESRRIVRCYTVADNENSLGSRFSEEEKQWVAENHLQNLQDLAWEEYKIFPFGEECMFAHEMDRFPQRDQPGAPIFHEINPIREQGELLNLVNGLKNYNPGRVRTRVKEILEYIIGIHDEHEERLVFRAKSDYHGFLCGFLVNFRYRVVADVYPELLIGKGYADVVLHVRGVDQASDSVPIIIELKVGNQEGLEQAKDYAKSCSLSSLPIHTSSPSAVCIALNFQLRGGAGLRTSVQPFSEGGLSLIPGLLHPHGNGVRGNVISFLQPIASEFTQSPHCDTFSCMSSFAFGNVLSTADLLRVAGRRRGVIITKYLFNHSGEEKMKRIRGRGDGANIVRHALTLALFVSNIGFVVLHIFRYLRSQTLPDKALNLSSLPQAEDNANVREVLCEVNVQSQLQVLSAKKFESLRAYSRSHREGYFEGEFSEQMGNVRNLHQFADELMSAEPNFCNNGNVNGEYRARYEVLLNEISRLLSPLLNRNPLLVNNEAKSQVLLRGIFQSCENPAKVIIEFQLERGKKIDLVLSQSAGNGDTHPIGVELKYARTAEQVERKRVEADRQLGEYESCGGCKRITGGNKMVLLYAILNAVGQGKNLISIGGLRETREFSR